MLLVIGNCLSNHLESTTALIVESALSVVISLLLSLSGILREGLV